METNAGASLRNAGLWNVRRPANQEGEAGGPVGDQGQPGFVAGPANDQRQALFQGMYDAPPNAPPRPQQQLPEVRDLVDPKMTRVLQNTDIKKATVKNFDTANDSMAQMSYKSGFGTAGATEGFFKSGKTIPDPLRHTIGDEFDPSDPRLAARGVMSSRLDKALGTNVLAEELFADHWGVKGSTSAMASGKQLMTKEWNTAPGEEWDERTMGGIYREDPKRPGAVQKPTPVINHGDFTGPETQRSAANLQLMDYLTGQMDRHPGNVFIDPKKGNAVTGIDNDASFGTRWHGKDAAADDSFGGEIATLPAQVDASTGQRLLGMKNEELMKILGGKDGDLEHLNEEEKAATLERFKALKEHIGTLKQDDKLVQSWNQDTYDQARQLGAGQSYTSRWAEFAEKAKDGDRSKLGKGVKLPS